MVWRVVHVELFGIYLDGVFLSMYYNAPYGFLLGRNQRFCIRLILSLRDLLQARDKL